MKKLFKKSIISLILASAISSLVSCGDENYDDPNKLTAPINLTVDAERTLKWDSVKNADRYIVSVSKESYSAEYFSLENEFLIVETKKGEYNLKVKALNSTGLLKESDYSSTYLYKIEHDLLTTPIISIKDSDVSWGIVSGATSYEVYVNNQKVENPSISTDGGICHFNFTKKDPGNYTISIKAVNSDGYSNMSNEVTYFADSPDDSEEWSYGTFGKKWAGGNEIFQGLNLYVHGETSISAENYVSIPEGKPYFKLSSMRLGDTYAAPEITMYVKDDDAEEYQIVRALATEENYVLIDTPNKVMSFAYDFSSFKGPVKIKITAKNSSGENGINIALPVIGFSEFGVNEHVSNKTAWSQSDIYLDWNNKITSMAGGENHGNLALASDEFIESKIKFSSEMNALKFFGTGCGSFKVYVNDELSDIDPNEVDDGTVYDFSDFIGQTIKVKFVSNGFGTIYSLGQIKFTRQSDTNEIWGYNEMSSKWTGGNLIFQGYQLCTTASATISTANYVTIPQGKPYFKFSVMKFGGGLANPNIKVYVKSNGITSLVKAVGYTTDYVQTPNDNLVYVYAYDLSSYSGAVSIKIEATNSLGENGVNIALQSIGFSEYGKTDHASTLTSWNDAQIYTDWITDEMSIRGDDTRCWPALATNQELTNTISITSQLNALKLFGTGCGSFKVYVNGTLTSVESNAVEDGAIYDFSDFVGQTIKVKFVANADGIIKSMQMINYVKPSDTNSVWGYDEMGSKWSGGKKIFQGYQLYTGSSSTISTSNYVTIPQGKPYFKFSVMKFGDAIAKPNIKVYVKSNGVISLVKAIGYDTDYVQTPEGNLAYIYAYDLSSYSGAVSIKIEATNSLGENGVNIALQSIGFSEYGKTDHTSTLTSWNDAQIYTDWNSDVMSIRGSDNRCWPTLATNQELTNTISITNQLNALKINGSNISNLKVYVNDGTDPIAVITGSSCGTIDLSSYIGQSVKIRLVGNGDIIIKSMEQINYNN